MTRTYQQKPNTKTQPSRSTSISQDQAVSMKMDLAKPLSVSTILQLQSTIGNHAVQRLIADRARQGVLQRQGANVVPAAPQLPGAGSVKMDAEGAAIYLDDLLFDSGGYFHVVRDQINKFRESMITELGWYAGDKKSEDTKHSTVAQVRIDLAKDKGKEIGKNILKTLIAGLTVGEVAGGPAGAAAGVLMSLAMKLLADDYKSVVLKEASSKPHQIYIEILNQIVDKQQNDLRKNWAANRSNAIKSEGSDGLTRDAAQIQRLTDQARQRLFIELAAGYMPIAPSHSLELETPHSEYTGEKQGNINFLGKVPGHITHLSSVMEIFMSKLMPAEATSSIVCKSFEPSCQNCLVQHWKN